MNITHFPTFAENLSRFQNELERVCRANNRDPKTVTIVAVTKTRSAAEINAAITAGITVIGENRVQEALQKFPELAPVERHLIGHLQTNKVREAVANCDCIESVDSLRLAEKLSLECVQQNKILPIFLQVNIAAEDTKSGFTVSELETALPIIRELPNLKLTGLMTIGPNTTDSAEIERVFRVGKMLTEQYGLANYSAGMSADWPTAIASGATHIRIGSALFGERVS